MFQHKDSSFKVIYQTYFTGYQLNKKYNENYSTERNWSKLGVKTINFNAVYIFVINIYYR